MDNAYYEVQEHFRKAKRKDLMVSRTNKIIKMKKKETAPLEILLHVLDVNRKIIAKG